MIDFELQFSIKATFVFMHQRNQEKQRYLPYHLFGEGVKVYSFVNRTCHSIHGESLEITNKVPQSTCSLYRFTLNLYLRTHVSTKCGVQNVASKM